MGSAQRLVSLFLLAFIVGLVALNIQQVQEPIDVSAIAPPETADPQNSPAPTLAAANLPSLAEFPETLMRPLFNADRRPRPAAPKPVAEAAPVPAPPSAPDAPAPTADGFRLIGMMRKGETDKRALIRTPANAQAKWVAAGGEIDGWRIDLIGKDRVLLTKGRRETELLLHAAPAAKAENDPQP